jgi:hypothetical protein
MHDGPLVQKAFLSGCRHCLIMHLINMESNIPRFRRGWAKAGPLSYIRDNSFYRPSVFTIVICMPHFSMPPVLITVSVQGDGHTALDAETRLVVKGDPCGRHNGTNRGNVTFVTQSSKNAFVLPSREFTLDDAYEEERVLREPALLIRLVGPGNMIPNSTERPYQHIFSHQVPVEQMMRCLDQGETSKVHAHTLEDGRKFDVRLE